MNMNGDREEWDTPCVGVCTTTSQGDEICAGCWRTASEVVNWNRLTQSEKVSINRRITFERGVDALCSFLDDYSYD